MLSSEVLEYSAFGSEVCAFTTRRSLGRDRTRICALLGLDTDRFVMPHQTHGADMIMIDEAFMALGETERKEQVEAKDAIMTNLPGILIGVSTADCIPVLLFDPANRAVAAVHAGWKGTVQRIVQSAIDCMQRQYATDPRLLKAVIGPGISMRNFEVGDEVYDRFAAEGFPMNRISRRYQKWHIDLPECNRLQLTDMGLRDSNIFLSPVCTFDNTSDFFSARVEQRGPQKCGRNFNAILLK